MKEENKNIDFSLNGIKTEQFAIIEDNYIPNSTTELGSEFQFKINQKNKQIGTFVEFEFRQKKKTFLKIQISCHFSIAENSWRNLINNNKLVVPKEFIAHLAMIATDTSRGVLFAKTEGTSFSKYIIPTLNLNDMIKEDISFELEGEG